MVDYKLPVVIDKPELVHFDFNILGILIAVVFYLRTNNVIIRHRSVASRAISSSVDRHTLGRLHA